jgi:hypothetical protein
MATETNGESTDPVRYSTQEKPVDIEKDVENPSPIGHHSHGDKVRCESSPMKMSC